MEDTPTIQSKWHSWLYWSVFALLIAWRFLHFGEQMDEPHSWRQYDTAQYIWTFSEEGIDLMHPSVGWMGGHKTLILEFPLPEAMAAILYNIFGPALFWARLVTLLFFAGSAIYFRAVLRSISTERLADLSALIYLCLPLGFFYSRAVHIDPAALFFGHAALYHVLMMLKSGKRTDLAFAAIFATLGFLVKAPYLFYLALPVAFMLIRARNWRAFIQLIPVILPAIVALIWWQWHTHAVNDSAPVWDFIPEYHKFVDMWGWYFSTLEIRFMGSLWEILQKRWQFEVLGGFLGYLPFAAGLLLFWRTPGANFMRFWLLGVMVYLLVFFPLNIVHDYYQLPFLAPAAFFVALAMDWLIKEIGKLGRLATAAMMYGTVLVFALNCARLVNRVGLKGDEALSFQNYLKVDQALVGFGELMRARLPKDALLIASYGGLDCRAPHLLYEARRYGWSIKTSDLSMPLILRLREEGADYLAVMAGTTFDAAWKSELTGFSQEVMPVPGMKDLSVYLWDFGGKE